MHITATNPIQIRFTISIKMLVFSHMYNVKYKDALKSTVKLLMRKDTAVIAISILCILV